MINRKWEKSPLDTNSTYALAPYLQPLSSHLFLRARWSVLIDKRKSFKGGQIVKLYLVEYTVGSVVKNMIVRAKDHNAAETQVKVSAIANIYEDNY